MVKIARKSAFASAITIALVTVGAVFYCTLADTTVSANVPEEAQKGLDYIKKNYFNYRIENQEYPANLSSLIDFSYAECLSAGKSSDTCLKELKVLISKDNDTSKNPLYGSNVFSYHVLNKRPDGQRYGSPKLKQEKDLISFTEIYLERKKLKDQRFLYGFYVALWDDGTIEKIPADEAIWYSTDGKTRQLTFRGQAGLPFSLLNEFDDDSRGGVYIDALPLLKPPTSASVVDNSGPESLVQLSRLVSFPNAYGIDRSKLWQTFDPAQAEFTLSDVQKGAAKLGFTTQIQKLTLDQLEKNATPAVLFLKDDGRIVTLAALDNDRAFVITRGLTRNVERSILQERYSGEALVPTKALMQEASIVADDAVREVKLPSLESEVPQQFTLRNTGTTSVALQLEYPLLGVTESKLSKDTIAPGETATLDLKVKWRAILDAPYQNVSISIKTDNPIVPRLQLAILLMPPETTDK